LLKLLIKKDLENQSFIDEQFIKTIEKEK